MTSRSTLARELAERRSGKDEVLLLWRPESDRVEVSVRDVTTGAGFQIDVAPGCALDAFYHPYVYAAKPENVLHADQVETAIVDG